MYACTDPTSYSPDTNRCQEEVQYGGDVHTWCAAWDGRPWGTEPDTGDSGGSGSPPPPGRTRSWTWAWWLEWQCLLPIIRHLLIQWHQPIRNTWKYRAVAPVLRVVQALEPLEALTTSALYRRDKAVHSNSCVHVCQYIPGKVLHDALTGDHQRLQQLQIFLSDWGHKNSWFLNLVYKKQRGNLHEKKEWNKERQR